MNINTMILESEGYSDEAVNFYKTLGKVYFNYFDDYEAENTKILVVRFGYYIDKSFLLRFPNLKLIASNTTGLNHIDIDLCKVKNIKVISLRDVSLSIKNITSTSELTFGLIITLVRNIIPAHNDVTINNNWNRYKFIGRQMSNLTIGIIGFGRIGRHIAKFSSAFGMVVYAYDPFISKEVFTKYNVKDVNKETLISNSDVISINADFRKSNINIISKKEIDIMKKGTVLVNSSRGELLNEKDIVVGLKSKKLGGVATDVISNEMNGKKIFSSPLIKEAKNRENIIITPHIGGCTKDAMEYTEKLIANYIIELEKNFLC